MTEIGIDLVFVKRFEKLTKKENFLTRNFTAYEKNYICGNSRQANCLAGIYAAKEAFLKALGIGLYNGIELLDIAILHDEKGRPYLNLSEEIKKKYGILEAKLSIAHDGDYATATCSLILS